MFLLKTAKSRTSMYRLASGIHALRHSREEVPPTEPCFVSNRWHRNVGDVPDVLLVPRYEGRVRDIALPGRRLPWKAAAEPVHGRTIFGGSATETPVARPD